MATEDMDALTFETPRLLRNVTMAGDNPIKEIDYKKVGPWGHAPRGV